MQPRAAARDLAAAQIDMTAVDSADRPHLSVVLPLVDDRGLGQAALASWLAQEAAEPFEIVVVANPESQGLARRAHGMLRPGDRMLDLPGGCEIELYQAGGEAARADLLLFTEAHCIAEPGSVAAVLRRFASTKAAALQLGGAGIAPNAFARFETQLLREGLGRYEGEHWRSVSLRGFAVRTAAWYAAGRFEVACGRLAEAILGVRLMRLGFTIEACDEARVGHGNCARPGELAAALRPHGRGQATWRERCERGLEAEFLPPLPDWSDRARWRRPLARRLASLHLAGLLDGGGRRAARSLAVALAGAIAGPAAPRLLAACRATCHLAGSRLAPGEARRYRAYSRASSELLRWGILEHAAASPLPTAPDAPGELIPSQLPDGVFAGFYPADRWQATDAVPTCRWTRPVAAMRLALPAADYRLRLAASVPGGDPSRVGVWLDGHRAPRDEEGAYRLERRWFGEGEQVLGFTSPAFLPSRHGLDDTRELGIALFAIRIETVTA